MFEKLKSLFRGKNSQGEINLRLAKKLHNMHFKYISEKFEDGSDKIIAKNGHINIEGDNNEYLCATCGVETVFRLEVSQMHIWEYMSLNGCVITFVDLDSGKERNVSVYYDAHLVRT